MLPSTASTSDQARYAFLVEKGNRSGSKRTVESYGRMLWRLFADTTPDRVAPADVLSHAHGVGPSGKPPSPATISARMACLSSCFRCLMRTGLVDSDPCDLVERPRLRPSPARGYSAEEVKRLFAVVPDTVRGRRDPTYSAGLAVDPQPIGGPVLPATLPAAGVIARRSCRRPILAATTVYPTPRAKGPFVTSRG